MLNNFDQMKSYVHYKLTSLRNNLEIMTKSQDHKSLSRHQTPEREIRKLLECLLIVTTSNGDLSV